MRAIDWQTITPKPGTFVDPEFANRHSDLLFTAQLDGKQAYVYLLLEHQSANHPYMLLRVLEYAVKVWLSYCKLP